ncbi:hypothetical protein HanXRQr2_Chr09g0367711 [Helianthus annuus]|uniref:Uncharacterized protein n=1 Tax=Helianthus annuus TaxID=4232 RepID=A0A9K3N7E6_HELAN|nr:hypothetical protein HanXRQr2_Chr09g0367711 [Helianthus annuus]KAJ0891471.1 hypothetical protein HanPSC8_Chr09g0354151 [Helianthus annuus]
MTSAAGYVGDELERIFFFFCVCCFVSAFRVLQAETLLLPFIHLKKKLNGPT